MPEAAAVSDQGNRTRMEDFHFLDTDFGGTGNVFAGVYDGHSGEYAAKHAAARLHLYFFHCLREGMAPPAAFRASYNKTSEDLKSQDSGTTAATLLLDQGHVHTANAGDSRIIVVGEDGATQLSVDHRLDDSVEFKRITIAGGKIDYPYVIKGLQGLMPTRALGDEYFRDVGVIPEPATRVHEILEKDKWLIAATDGLFDELDNEEVTRLCSGHTEPRLVAETLVKEALTRCARADNTTVIVIKLH
jgi:serine/threonine protein phosphatase PrpC